MEPGALLRKGIKFASYKDFCSFADSKGKKKKQQHVASNVSECDVKKARFSEEKMDLIKNMLSEQRNSVKEPSEKSEKKSNENLTKMEKNMLSSEFRVINEKLYIQSGKKSLQMFDEDERMFEVYHDGFSQQLAKWPIDPMDGIVKAIAHKYKTACRTTSNVSESSASPFVVVDMGCGTCRLKHKLMNTKSTSQINVKSIDFVAKESDVIACDMSKTPLDTSSADVVVFCLSLMSPNPKEYVLEAHRILKPGCLLIIVEPESRFEETTVKQFITIITTQYGFDSKRLEVSTNKYFVYLQFTKRIATEGLEDGSSSQASNGKQRKKMKLSDIKLKPCVYKKR